MLTRVERRRKRPAPRRVATIAILALVGAAIGVVAALSTRHHGQHTAASTTARTATTARVATRPRAPARLAERRLGALPSAVQDAAATVLPHGRVVLLGGLTAADTSRADVLVVRGTRASSAAPLLE